MGDLIHVNFKKDKKHNKYNIVDKCYNGHENCDRMRCMPVRAKIAAFTSILSIIVISILITILVFKLGARYGWN
jgi:hypothetical protein